MNTAHSRPASPTEVTGSDRDIDSSAILIGLRRNNTYFPRIPELLRLIP